MTTSELHDGIILLEVLSQMDGNIWQKDLISYKETSFSKENFILINQGLQKFYKKQGCPPLENFQRKDLINPDVNKYSQPSEMLRVLQLVVGVAVQCENKESLINDIMSNLDEDAQSELMEIIQQILQKYAPQCASDFSSMTSAQVVTNTSHDSSSYQIGELQVTIEKLELQNKKFLMNLKELEQENASLKVQYQESLKEIENLKGQIVQQNINKKTLMLQKTLEDLQLEHGDLEVRLNQVREYESVIELNKRKIFDLEKGFEKARKEFEIEKSQLQEELDIEREKNLMMQKIELQMQTYKKKAEDYSSVQMLVEQRDQKIRDLEESLINLELENSKKKELEVKLQFLREELTREKAKTSQYEINIENKDHSISDLQKELKLQKKKEEVNVEKISQLEQELEEVRGRDSMFSVNDQKESLQQSLISDLEERLKSLSQENQLLKMNNSSEISQKLFELEQNLIEEQRQKHSLQQKLEMQIQRCQRFEDENENLKFTIQTGAQQKKGFQSKQGSPTSGSQLEDKLLIQQQSLRIKELESLSSEVKNLQNLRDQHMLEIKGIYQDKNQMMEQILKLKDELSNTKSLLQEIQIKERFFEKEKQLLESQIKNQISFNPNQASASEINKLKAENTQLRITLKKLESAFLEREQAFQLSEKDFQREKERELRIQEKVYEQKIAELKNTIHELNEDILNEKQIKQELEESNKRQDQLMSSLIHNLGQQFLDMQKDMSHKNSWLGMNASQSASSQSQSSSGILRDQGNISGSTSQRGQNENVNKFLARKRQNTYKTFQTQL